MSLLKRRSIVLFIVMACLLSQMQSYPYRLHTCYHPATHKKIAIFSHIHRKSLSDKTFVEVLLDACNSIGKERHKNLDIFIEVNPQFFSKYYYSSTIQKGETTYLLATRCYEETLRYVTCFLIDSRSLLYGNLLYRIPRFKRVAEGNSVDIQDNALYTSAVKNNNHLKMRHIVSFFSSILSGDSPLEHLVKKSKDGHLLELLNNLKIRYQKFYMAFFKGKEDLSFEDYIKSFRGIAEYYEREIGNFLTAIFNFELLAHVLLSKNDYLVIYTGGAHASFLINSLVSTYGYYILDIEGEEYNGLTPPPMLPLSAINKIKPGQRL